MGKGLVKRPRGFFYFKLFIQKNQYSQSLSKPSKHLGQYELKGTVSLFWPRGPEIAFTSLRNELIVKLRNSLMGASYGRNGENFQLLFQMTRFLFKMTRLLFRMTSYFLKWLSVTLHIKKVTIVTFLMTRFLFNLTSFLFKMTQLLFKMTSYFLKWP